MCGWNVGMWLNKLNMELPVVRLPEQISFNPLTGYEIINRLT